MGNPHAIALASELINTIKICSLENNHLHSIAQIVAVSKERDEYGTPTDAPSAAGREAMSEMLNTKMMAGATKLNAIS
jgi:hypothetical protein